MPARMGKVADKTDNLNDMQLLIVIYVHVRVHILEGSAKGCLNIPQYPSLGALVPAQPF